MDSTSIEKLMKRVCDYQLALQRSGNATSQADINFEWIRGVFYTGVMALYEATGDSGYLDAALEYSNTRDWQLDKPETRHADWQCVGQLYTELFLLDPASGRDQKRIEAVRQNIAAQMNSPKPGREDWWWCDALYMAPPLLARLHAATGDPAYLGFLDEMFWDAYDFLYDPEEHLFFRDYNYFEQRSANGQKVFWSRGNGWVLGGLARVIPFLPEEHPTRNRYVELFKDMAARIAPLQGSDGLWRTSLLDPDEFPDGESSGSAFFTYALAWGINNGLLDDGEYREAVERGWDGLAGCVTPEGKLGHVQTVAAAPGKVDPNDTREYAAGAFLLAGAELLRLRAKTPA